MCVAMTAWSLTRPPRLSAVSVQRHASDGDGYSLLKSSAVMKDAVKFIPELAVAIAALEINDHGCF
jgi:hypothetical protein